MATTQKVKLDKWYDVHNRVGRLIGTVKVFKWDASTGYEGYGYKGHSYNRKGEEACDFTGDNGDYPTIQDAFEAAEENARWDS